MRKILLIPSVLIAILAVAVSAVPVLACECEEWVNPHGANIPPAGWSTLPGDNPNSGKNPDGFYRIKSQNPAAGMKIYFSWVGNTGAPLGPFDFQAIPAGLPKHATDGANDGFLSQFTVKFTEAPGATPSAKLIGSNNGQGNGQAGAVMLHVTLPADPLWRTTFEGSAWWPLEPGTDIVQQGGYYWDGCCVVPPPPK